jgi:hypothetical protein
MFVWTNKINVRKTKWLEFLNKYDFDIKHIKGNENKVVDALDRRVHEMHATIISMHNLELKGGILEAVTTYHHYVQVKERLQ